MLASSALVRRLRTVPALIYSTERISAAHPGGGRRPTDPRRTSRRPAPPLARGHDRAGGSGEEALRVFNDQEPDVVFLNASLPDLSGLEVLRQIRQDSDAAVI